MVPAYNAKVSRTNVPSCTMWFRQFTKYVTKYGAIPTQPRMTHYP
jgi:hypothetical protein